MPYWAELFFFNFANGINSNKNSTFPQLFTDVCMTVDNDYSRLREVLVSFVVI